MAARQGSSGAIQVGIYTRISKDDEAEGLGVARQEEDCRLHCAARGWEVARVYEDNDLSAYKRKTVRPEFRQMLEDLKAGRIDGVVAWDIDRFTRQPRDLEAWIDEYEDAERRKRHLVFDSVSASDIDLSTEDGRFIARIRVTIANKSSADTSKRTKRKHLELAAKGKLPGGRAPYGWNREDRRTLVPDEAENLRKAVRDFLGGVRWASIAREWRDKGVRSHSGGVFDDSKIKRMLVNPRICGYRMHQGELFLDEHGAPVVGDWEPIVTPDEWYLLMEKVRKESEGRTARDYATKYLLSGIARCGRCGAKMRAFPSYRKSKTSSQFRYACPGRNDGGCGGVARAGEPVDRLIRSAVFLSSDKALAHVRQRAPEWTKEEHLASLESDMAEFKQAWQEKRMSATRYIVLTEDLEKQIAELHRERSLHRAEVATFEVRPVDIRERWEKLTIEQQRAAVLKVFRAVVVKPASNGPIFDPGDIEPVLR
ncbi:recombinase family protein [Streptomyces collinus]|uniref:Integrase/recombinase n=1 Tax=Streptomyces collinus (strain DSM 40733 / Tue 365) TaxID=1214242 RepID=S5UUI2_STRC3|nr:recombinase family protein [Streptomyces collinus]AGS70818.1 integrase/recombinase [Streptomyces collinus Tu 365]UJA09468.1 recombinase family protein [Streptomyces collinus]UJA15668.1 recombinase family protein [Streptomyces collinus]